MGTIGLAVVTVLLSVLAVRCSKMLNRVTVAVFWLGYAVSAAVFAGVV